MTAPSRRAPRRVRDPGEPAQAPDRRLNIQRSAERLFAAHGFHGVSIRDIADEAGVPLALVGYYFGPKADLYHTIFRERTGYIQERLQILAQVQRDSPPAFLLDEIVRAFVLPVLEVAATPDGRVFLRLMARGMTDQFAEDEALIRELFDPLAHAFIDTLAVALPQASRGTLAWCYQFALGALLHHVIDARVERLSLGANHPGDGATAGPLLMRFIAAGIRGACATPTH